MNLTKSFQSGMRKTFWQERTDFRSFSSAWVVAGDFNVFN